MRRSLTSYLNIETQAQWRSAVLTLVSGCLLGWQVWESTPHRPGDTLEWLLAMGLGVVIFCPLLSAIGIGVTFGILGKDHPTVRREPESGELPWHLVQISQAVIAAEAFISMSSVDNL